MEGLKDNADGTFAPLGFSEPALGAIVGRSHLTETAMAQAKQWWVLVRYKDEAGTGFGRQYVTATNSYEAIQMAKALYGRLLISEGASPA